MVFGILIYVGASVYNFDNLKYPNLDTCLHHKERILDNFRLVNPQGRGGMKVECKKLTKDSNVFSNKY